MKQQRHKVGDIWKYKDGYLYTKIAPDDPFYDSTNYGTIYLHRLVMMRHLGRSLIEGETVIHKDGNPENNDISNLELVSNGGRPTYDKIIVCPKCGYTAPFKEFFTGVTEDDYNVFRDLDLDAHREFQSSPPGFDDLDNSDDIDDLEEMVEE